MASSVNYEPYTHAGGDSNGTREVTYILTNMQDSNMPTVNEIVPNSPTFIRQGPHTLHTRDNFPIRPYNALSITMMNCLLFNNQVRASDEHYADSENEGVKFDPFFQIDGKMEWKFVGMLESQRTADRTFGLYRDRVVNMINGGPFICPQLFDVAKTATGFGLHFVLKMVDFNHRNPYYRFYGTSSTPAVMQWTSTPPGARWAPQWVAVSTPCVTLPLAARKYDIQYLDRPKETRVGRSEGYGQCTRNPNWINGSDHDASVTWFETEIADDNRAYTLDALEVHINVV